MSKLFRFRNRKEELSETKREAALPSGEMVSLTVSNSTTVDSATTQAQTVQDREARLVLQRGEILVEEDQESHSHYVPIREKDGERRESHEPASYLLPASTLDSIVSIPAPSASSGPLPTRYNCLKCKPQAASSSQAVGGDREPGRLTECSSWCSVGGLQGGSPGGGASSSTLVDDEIEKIGVGRFHYFGMIILGIGNAADAAEITTMGYILPVYKDSKGNPASRYQKELLSAAVFAGMFLGGLIWGRVSDRFGRRHALLWSMLVNTTAGAVSAFSWSTYLLIACRVICGFGIGGTIPPIFTLCTELCPHNRRGFFISLVASFWMLGAFYTAGLAWAMFDSILPAEEGGGTTRWRAFILLCEVPALLCITLSYFHIPESPRFLVMKQRFDQAVVSLKKIAKANGKDGYCIQPAQLKGSDLFVLRAPLSSSTSLSSSAAAGGAVGGPTIGEEKYLLEETPMRALFQGRLRLVSCVLMVIWFSLSFGTYGVSTWITELFSHIHLENPYQSAFIYVSASLPGNIFSMVFMDRIGRKVMVGASMALGAASALAFGFMSDKNSTLVVITSFLFNMFSIPAWNALDALSTECFPTSLRASAMGTFGSFGRIASMAAQFVNGALVSQVMILLSVTSSCLFIGSLAALFLPKRQKLSEIDDPAHHRPQQQQEQQHLRWGERRNANHCHHHCGLLDSSASSSRLSPSPLLSSFTYPLPHPSSAHSMLNANANSPISSLLPLPSPVMSRPAPSSTRSKEGSNSALQHTTLPIPSSPSNCCCTSLEELPSGNKTQKE